MRHLTLFFSALFILTCGYAQTTGSGTITFSASTNVPIEATATSLFDSGAHVYQISGNTNEAINFSGWVVEGTLGNNEVNFTEDVFLTKNPSGALNLFIKANKVSDVTAIVFDVNGRLVSQPQPLNSSKGVVHIYDPMSNLSDGLYFVEVSNKDKKHSLKFIKKGEDNGPLTVPSKSKNKGNSNASRTILANNYIITWNNNGSGFYSGSHSTQILEGSGNTITTGTTPVVGTENGNNDAVALLGGNPKTNVTVTITNTITPDSTYTVSTGDGISAIFYYIYVSDANNPTSYQVDFTSDNEIFLPTTVYHDMYQDVNFENNTTVITEVTPILNEQDITMVVRDYKTLTEIVGVTVFMYKTSDDSLLDTQITDANGEVLFDNVSGETEVYFKHSKTGYYTKTNNNYTTPLVNRISKMDTILNVTAIQKYNYSNSDPATAEQIGKYLQSKYNPEFLHGHWYSNTGGNATVNADFTEMVALVGMAGAFIESTNPNLTPTQEMIDNYNPYTGSPEYLGQVGAFVTNPSAGGSTGAYTISIAPGIIITIHTWVFDLGPTKAKRMHEGLQALGFRLVDQDAIIPLTVMDSTNPSEFSIWDENMITTTILGRNHFVFSDSDGRPMEYAYTINIEE